MTKTIQQNGTGKSGKRAFTFGTLGFLCIIGALLVLYSAERTNNQRWIASRAKTIDPASPGTAAGMVKFTGMPEGELITDSNTGKRFVVLSIYNYEYGKDKLSTSGFGWNYFGGSNQMAKGLRIGALNIRLEEAKIIGRDAWTMTIFNPDRGSGAAPRPGDLKTRVSGIPEDAPLFCVGNLSGDYLGSAKLFVVSSFSEGKTLEKLREIWVWRWIRHPICFVLLFIGFAFLGYPIIAFLRSIPEDSPARALARIGWPSYLALCLAASFALVRFSYFTADLLWAFLILIPGIPILRLALKKWRAAPPSPA